MKNFSLLCKIKILLGFIKGCHEKKYDFHCQALHLHEKELLNKSSFHSRFHRLSALCAGMDDNSVKKIIRFLYFSALYWDSSNDELLVSPILAVPPETLVNFEREKPLWEKRFGIPKEDLYFESFHPLNYSK